MSALPTHPRRRVVGCACALVVLVAAASAAAPVPRTAEQARADAAGPAPAAGAPSAVVHYRVPLDPVPTVARPFDPPVQRWLPGHRGVDLVAGPAPVVVAPADGVVTFAGPVAGRGVVTVLHPDGLRSSLEPVEPAVPRGARVTAGSVIGAVTGPAHGTIAPTGGVVGAPSVHWGVREEDGTYVDPWSLLPGSGPVVLLP